MKQLALAHLPLNRATRTAGKEEQANHSTRCLLDLRDVRRGEPGRYRLERYIRKRCQQAYGAAIQQLLPNLLVLRKPDDTIVGALGYQPADEGSLFLEAYLDRPIEDVLNGRLGTPSRRSSIVEVGNLVTSMSGGVRRLMELSTAFFKETGFRWVVFIATPMALYFFARLGLNSVWLAPVVKEHAANEKTRGDYYDVDSWVVACDIVRGLP